MKVILKKDVPKLGVKGDIVEVSDGYAINYLMPQKLAVRATVSIIKEKEMKDEQKKEKSERKETEKEEEMNNLAEKKLKIKEKTNEKGNLFKGIDKKDIAEILKKEGYKNIEEKDILLEKPIKETGEFEIEILGSDKNSKFTLVIESDR